VSATSDRRKFNRYSNSCLNIRGNSLNQFLQRRLWALACDPAVLSAMETRTLSFTKSPFTQS